MSSCLLVNVIKIGEPIIANVSKFTDDLNIVLTKLGESPIVKAMLAEPKLIVTCNIICDINKNGFLISDEL